MKKEKKTSYICFRVSPREKEQYRQFAVSAGVSLGQLIRNAVHVFMSKPGANSSSGGSAYGKK